LRRQAVAAGKLPERYRIPARYRDNRPERLARTLRAAGLVEALPWYPLGSDFTAVEAELTVALGALGEQQGRLPALAPAALDGRHHKDDPRLVPALERMGLARPRGIRARVLQALVAAALAREVHDNPRPLLPPSAGQRQATSL